MDYNSCYFWNILTPKPDPHLGSRDHDLNCLSIRSPRNFCLQMDFMIFLLFVYASSLLVKTDRHFIPSNYFSLLLLEFLVKGMIFYHARLRKQSLRFRRQFINYQFVSCIFWVRHRFHHVLLVSLTFTWFMNFLLVLVQVIT